MYTKEPRFLIVDRDISLRQRFMAVLKGMGYTDVFTTPSGTQAWTLLKQRGADVLVAGVHLADISGISLLKIVRADAQFAFIPFLLVAEMVTKEEVLEAGEAGVSEILCRPLSEERIQKKFQAILDPATDHSHLEAQRHYQEGIKLMQQQRYNEALGCFKQVLTDFEHPEVYYNLGYINTLLENYEEAITYFHRATEIDHRCARAFQKMSECYHAMGQSDQAEQSLNRAVDIYLEKEKEGTSREEILAEVMSANPQTINIYNTMGILLRRQGKHREAAAQYQKALKVNPRDEHIFFNLARCLFEAGDQARAATALTSALKLNPAFAEAKDLLQLLQTRTAASK
ncbi:MAG: tetratricopeptide repeat protein [Deltaproteobacteria bacterium]|nr:tetratricopeptide repeat protein [Deltaproteobacteria bacterium]